MAIKLSPATEEQLIASLQRYFDVNMDDSIGELKTRLLLDFCIREIGPGIYNQAIADAQSALQDKVAELEVTCYEAEFSYWNKK